MKAMLKDAVILFIITLVAGAVLGVVNDITTAPIQQQKLQAKQAAFKEVFQAAESFEVVSDNEEELTADIAAGGFTDSINEVAAAKDASGNTIGYVLTVTSHSGYGGNIQFSMGITTDGNLNGISILQIAETAGLGMRAEEVLKPQFENRNSASFTVTKSGSPAEDEINAISSATITSNAVTNAVNAGLYYFQNSLSGGVAAAAGSALAS